MFNLEDYVGTYLWTPECGWGIVERQRSLNPDYPYKVGDDTFLSDGKLTKSDKYPSVFLSDPVNGTLRPTPETDWTTVKRGTTVLVRSGDYAHWIEREFIAYVEGAEEPFVTVIRQSVDNVNLQDKLYIWEQAKLKQ